MRFHRFHFPQAPDEYRPGWRLQAALVCVLVSAPGILISAGMGIGGLLCLLQRPPPSAGDVGPLLLLGLPFLFSWIAFFHMLWGWLCNRGVSEFWLSWGTFIGTASVVLANVFALAVLPAILLAMHLRRFHRRLDQQQRAGATP